ncbi:MAG: prolipoprotein diacylglyceryl transferase family protein [Bacteroidota bacterium]
MYCKIPVVFWHGRSFNLVTFGLFATAGSMAGYSIAFFYLQTRGIEVIRYCWEMTWVLLFFNLLFAKLYAIFSTGRSEYFTNLRSSLNETSFYQQGGIIGSLLGTILLYPFLDIPYALLGDAVGLGGLVTMFIGRLGCLNYGCCIGKPSTGRFGFIYTDPEAKICRDHPGFLNISLIPVQLIASLVDFLLFIICCMISVWLPYSGMIMIIFFVVVNMKRILLQPLRYKASSNRIPYQWVAFVLIVIFLMILLFLRNSGESFFVYEPPVVPFTVKNYLDFIFSDMDISSSLILVGAVNFAAYGIHGRRLGTHFNLVP